MTPTTPGLVFALAACAAVADYRQAAGPRAYGRMVGRLVSAYRQLPARLRALHLRNLVAMCVTCKTVLA